MIYLQLFIEFFRAGLFAIGGREISVVTTAKADDLNIFQIGPVGSLNGGCQHTSMVVVYHIQATLAQVNLLQTVDSIYGQNGQTALNEHIGQIVVADRT